MSNSPKIQVENRLGGHNALITGASRGIGRAAAIALAERGMNVALVGRSKETLEEVATACQKFDVKTSVIEYDLSNADDTKSVVDQAVKDLGGIHVLINNAGRSNRSKADEADLEKWDAVLDTNLRSLMHLTRHTLPEIEKDHWGAVINIASVSGKMSHPAAGIYAATKHGVVGFTGSLFEDVRERNIKVCAICPGFVNTPMVSGRGLDDSRMIQPEDIAKTILFVLDFPDTGCPTEIMVRPQRSPYTSK